MRRAARIHSICTAQQSAGSEAGAFVSVIHLNTADSSLDRLHAFAEPEQLFHVMPSMHKMKLSPLHRG
jgi:hypothetical protein